MTDDGRAESELARGRTARLREQLRKAETNFQRILNEGLKALHQSGNKQLAGRYQSAVERFRCSHEAANRHDRAGELNQAALDAIEDALRELGRVEAEVNAWLDSPERNAPD